MLDACLQPLAILGDGVRVTHANAAFCDLMDRNAGSVGGRTLGEIGLTSVGDTTIDADLEGALAGRKPDARRASLSTSGGRRIVVEFAARRIVFDGGHTGGILVGLSRRMRGRTGPTRHDRNLALLKSISASTSDTILTLTEDGVVEMASTSVERMFGYSSSEAVGMDLGRLISRATNGDHVDTIKDALKDENSERLRPAPGDYLGLRKDGDRFPVEVSISEIDDERRFTCMIRDVSERKRLEQQILDISADEQRRIGLELHDDTLQAFTGMQLVAEELLDLLAPDSHESNLVRTLAESSAAASRRTRLLARGLMPARIPGGGLVTAIEALARDIGELHSVTVLVECSDDALGLPDSDVATHVFRVVQEAASNAARHSGSEHIRISLAREEQRFVVRVADGGMGFDDEDNDGNGLGLKIMAYRADLIGAELSIERWRDGGAVVVLSVPHNAADVEGGAA